MTRFFCKTTNSQGKRRRSRPLDRRVRPEGQKGAPGLEDVRGPRKTAGPRKRRSAGTGGCAHEAGDGTNERK